MSKKQQRREELEALHRDGKITGQRYREQLERLGQRGSGGPSIEKQKRRLMKRLNEGKLTALEFTERWSKLTD